MCNPYPGIFRVLVPDCAFQLQIPPDQRQYLGNWMTESTADVYTREKRNVVVDIWGKVAAQMPHLKLTPDRECREDLNHQDWADQKVEEINVDDYEWELPPNSNLGDSARPSTNES